MHSLSGVHNCLGLGDILKHGPPQVVLHPLFGKSQEMCIFTSLLARMQGCISAGDGDALHDSPTCVCCTRCADCQRYASPLSSLAA